MIEMITLDSIRYDFLNTGTCYLAFTIKKCMESQVVRRRTALCHAFIFISVLCQSLSRIQRGSTSYPKVRPLA